MTQGKPTGGDQRTPEQIERDIEATREELGETVTAVADRADVKKQAHRKVDEVKEKVGARQAGSLARENPLPVGLAAAFVAGLVLGRILTRR